MPRAYVNVDLKLEYDQEMSISDFTSKMAALFAHGTVRDALDAAGFSLLDVVLEHVDGEFTEEEG